MVVKNILENVFGHSGVSNLNQCKRGTRMEYIVSLYSNVANTTDNLSPVIF